MAFDWSRKHNDTGPAFVAHLTAKTVDVAGVETTGALDLTGLTVTAIVTPSDTGGTPTLLPATAVGSPTLGVVNAPLTSAFRALTAGYYRLEFEAVGSGVRLTAPSDAHHPYLEGVILADLADT